MIGKPVSTDLTGYIFGALGLDGDLYSVRMSGTVAPDGSMVLVLKGSRGPDATPIRVHETMRIDAEAAKTLMRVFDDSAD